MYSILLWLVYMHMDYFSIKCYKDYLCNVYSRSSRLHLLHNDDFEARSILS
jgi:hypothetical protein